MSTDLLVFLSKLLGHTTVPACAGGGDGGGGQEGEELESVHGIGVVGQRPEKSWNWAEILLRAWPPKVGESMGGRDAMV